jgi:FkbM family methyltransferase
MIDFIQIGANIGNTPQDIIWKFIREKDWKGIFVEPVTTSFNILKENYSDLDGCYFEQSAIGSKDGEITIYSRSDGFSDRQQASTIKTHFKNDFEEVVSCMTLNTLVEKYDMVGKQFELLQIDAEGMDDLIILNTDFTKVLPEKIRFEVVHIKKYGRSTQTVLKYLKSFGYEIIKDEYIEHVKSTESGYDIMVKK